MRDRATRRYVARRAQRRRLRRYPWADKRLAGILRRGAPYPVRCRCDWCIDGKRRWLRDLPDGWSDGGVCDSWEKEEPSE